MVKWLIAGLLVLACSAASAESGKASYYGKGFHGRKTASGERFNMHAMTCAHRTKPFGSLLTVTYKGRTVQCRVSDRGPHVRGRIVDLSYAAARQIGLIAAGVGRVTIY